MRTQAAARICIGRKEPSASVARSASLAVNENQQIYLHKRPKGSTYTERVNLVAILYNKIKDQDESFVANRKSTNGHES